MAEISTLKNQRSQIRAQLTRFNTFIDSSTEENVTQIPDRLIRAETLLKEFEEVQEKIELIYRQGAVGEDGTQDRGTLLRLEQDFNEDRGNFENKYYEIINKARQKMPRPLQPNNLAPTEVISNRQRTNETETNVKLPTLSLPTFNGNYDRWLLFKDSFKSLIHSNSKLTDIQKFQYLRSSLTDEALQVLQSLETSAENYEIGWSLLIQRYENKRLIINTHMKELFEVLSVPKGNLTSLRQFIDSIQTHTRALESLGQPVNTWDTILIHLLSSKLDFHTRKDWEIHIGNKEDDNLPTMKQWLEFLTSRCHTLELVDGTNSKQNNSNYKKDKRVTLATTTPHCEYCNGQHFIYRCEDFIKLPIQTRQSEATSKQLCINCLRKGHYARECKSSGCRKCSRQHNTLLHQEKGFYKDNAQEKRNEQRSDESAKTSKEESPTTTVTVYCFQDIDKPSKETTEEDTKVVTHTHKIKSQVILSTAQVHVFDSQGSSKKCRVLLDPGSQSNLITKALADKLKLPTKKVNIPISGIGQGRSNIKESVQIKLKSIYNNYQAPINCLVLDTITEPLPQVRIDTKGLAIPQDIRLADPNYETPGTIDLLIGAGLFWQLLCVGRIETGRNQPILQKTLLGWVIGGESKIEENTNTITACCVNVNNRIDQLVESFWRIEEVKIKDFPTREEKQCEQYYTDTVTRAPDGRFIVRLPIDQSITLGESKPGALRRFHSTERRLKEEPDLQKEYVNFLTEYEKLGHMSLVKEEDEQDPRKTYYLPHQPVIRKTSLSTKLRVVFDGSAKTSLGTSLNDKLLTGPNLQEEILDIILRFRCHQYVITADVAMMFRQIIIAEEDRNFQRILWRTDSSQPVRAYTLNTVTYGTSCAPYLAMRCLKQLAIEESTNFPQASRAILQDCYMDDVLTGSETLGEIIELQQQLNALLQKGKFPLRKWRSNNEEVLAHLSEAKRADDLMILDPGKPMKTLGLLWNAAEDILQYSVSVKETINPTKRSILSKIAKIYDPLGLLGPILITAKIIMQELWKLQLSWDESVPQSLYTLWYDYYNSLPMLNKLKIPRNVNPKNASHRMELHGFSDASEK